MADERIAFIEHGTQDLGDHGREWHGVVFFDADDTVKTLLDYMKKAGVRLELTRQHDPKKDDGDEIPF